MSDLNSLLAEYFDLSIDEAAEMDLEGKIHENTGSTGEMVYSYYFAVPESTPQSVLDSQGWTVGDHVELPLNAFDEDEGF